MENLAERRIGKGIQMIVEDYVLNKRLQPKYIPVKSGGKIYDWVESDKPYTAEDITADAFKDNVFHIDTSWNEALNKVREILEKKGV